MLKPVAIYNCQLLAPFLAVLALRDSPDDPVLASPPSSTSFIRPQTLNQQSAPFFVDLRMAR
jgi:hypothetical protein